MPEIAELQKEIRNLEQQVTDFAEAGKVDAAHEATGRLGAFREMLVGEANRLEEANKALAERLDAVGRKDLRTVGERALGAEDAFREIAPGWQAVVPNAGTIHNAATTLPTPKIEDNNLPALVTQPMGFLDTIVQGVTAGDEKYFLPPALTNGAATWTLGATKAESSIAWTEHTSQLETIAHWIPVHKQMVNRYKTLESQISNALMTGLRMVRNQKCIFGNNSNGIIGVTNFPGILTWAKNASDNIVDNLADMATRVRVASGYSPNCVALSPETIREIAKTKDQDGMYLFPNFKAGDVVPGTNMVAVEDVNMDVTTVTENKGDQTNTYTTKRGAVVYYNGVISYKAAMADEVTIGLVDKQFIQNSYTLLGEGDGLLRVDAPAAICFCAELGTTQTRTESTAA